MLVELENVKGLKELQDALYQLPVNIAKNVLRGSVLAGGGIIRDQAKLNAPVYTGEVAQGHPPPGTLKRSVYVKHIPDRSNSFKQVYFVGVRKGKKYQKQGKGGKLSQDAFYASWVEFGHYYAPPGKHGFATRKKAMNAVSLDGGGVTGARFVMPQPFMRPAFESKKQSAVKAIKDYLATRIPLEIQKLRKR